MLKFIVSRHRLKAVWAIASLAAFAAVVGACGSDTVTERVVETVIVERVITEKVVETVIVEKIVTERGDVVIQTVIVEQDVPVTVLAVATPTAGAELAAAPREVDWSLQSATSTS